MLNDLFSPNNTLYNVVVLGLFQNKDLTTDNRDNKMKVALLLTFIGPQAVSAVTPFEAIIEELEVVSSSYFPHEQHLDLETPIQKG